MYDFDDGSDVGSLQPLDFIISNAIFASSSAPLSDLSLTTLSKASFLLTIS